RCGSSNSPGQPFGSPDGRPEPRRIDQAEVARPEGADQPCGAAVVDEDADVRGAGDVQPARGAEVPRPEGADQPSGLTVIHEDADVRGSGDVQPTRGIGILCPERTDQP